MNNLKDIHNMVSSSDTVPRLFNQDFNVQFEGYTQHVVSEHIRIACCLIMISMNNLKDIHNLFDYIAQQAQVV